MTTRAIAGAILAFAPALAHAEDFLPVPSQEQINSKGHITYFDATVMSGLATICSTHYGDDHQYIQSYWDYVGDSFVTLPGANELPSSFNERYEAQDFIEGVYSRIPLENFIRDWCSKPKTYMPKEYRSKHFRW